VTPDDVKSISAQAQLAKATLALRGLAYQARVFAAYWPHAESRMTPTAQQARALAGLVQAAQAYAAKSDAEWAAEVAELLGLLRVAYSACDGRAAWLGQDEVDRIKKLLEE
jgi:hypothetical protein